MPQIDAFTDRTHSRGFPCRFSRPNSLSVACRVGSATRARFVTAFGHDEALVPLKMARTGILEAEPCHLVCRQSIYMMDGSYIVEGYCVVEETNLCVAQCARFLSGFWVRPYMAHV
jgi:hypothetical protein